MNKNIVLIGIIIGLTTALLVPTLPQQTKASTCTSAAMSAGRSGAFYATQSSATTARQVAPTRDTGCASGGIAVANQGTFCFAANNGQAGSGGGGGGQQPFLGTVGSSSCSASNHAPIAQRQTN